MNTSMTHDHRPDPFRPTVLATLPPMPGSGIWKRDPAEVAHATSVQKSRREYALGLGHDSYVLGPQWDGDALRFHPPFMALKRDGRQKRLSTPR